MRDTRFSIPFLSFQVLVAIFNELPQCHVLANQNAPFGHVVRALSLWAPSSSLYGAFHTFQCGLNERTPLLKTKKIK